jgi:hypothetical protein
MGDEKYYTIQIKGTAYRFRPLDPEDVVRVSVVLNMGASPQKSIKGLTHLLAKSAGEEQWDAITDRLITGELEVKDVTTSLLKKLIDRQNKDAQPVSDDDAE